MKIFLFIFYYLVFFISIPITPPLPQFIEITGGYNAGRQRDYGDAKQRG